MALCLGCGLEQDATTKRLGVKLCPTGGIQCATTAEPSPDGCQAGLYIAVQGQTACVDLATAQTQCPSPNCNGVVLTCDNELWAPPKTHATVGFWSRQEGSPNGNLSGYIFPKPATVDLGQPAFAADSIFAGQSSQVAAWEIQNTSCNDIGGLVVSRLSGPTFLVKPGEIWRFILFERIAVQAASGPIPAGTVWAQQDIYFADNNGNGPAYRQVQLSDNTHFGYAVPPGQFARGEMLITVNRLQGNGPIDNEIPAGAFMGREYRGHFTSAHCDLPDISNQNGQDAS